VSEAGRLPPLWQCAQCGRTFANRNQTHSCGRATLEHHFARKPASIRTLYDHFVALIRTRCGPVEVLPEKTRIAFHVRMSFAQLTPRQRWIDGHFVLDRPTSSRHVRKVERYGPRSHVHSFRLLDVADMDDDFVTLLQAAYVVGQQRHLTRAGESPRDGAA
jgi:hypothetical protein